MSQRLATLRTRFREAKADADASSRAVRRASAAKLAELLALPDAEARLAGLKDPALLPYDRKVLENAIADVLPRRRIQLPRSARQFIRSGLRHVCYRWQGLVICALIAIPLTVIGSSAVRNTGVAKVYFDRPFDFEWTFPDGHSQVYRLPVGTAVLVMGRNAAGDVRLRFWSAKDGHGETVMPAAVYAQFAISNAE
ncbi:MAG: hypothetical protein CFE29_28415 [Bradyrhizobiaceae bacterium PARB1]|jgi:hypothetical protein|nr:MAG: hypothetical protein CFE29_28415 [Bradyrhizobiaceae bacterium PARB1]